MHKYYIVAVLVTVGILPGNSLAQTPPAATSPASSTPASPASTAKAQTPAPKAHSATAAKTATPLALKTQKDKFSYALGMSNGKRLAESLHKNSVPFDPAIMARGMKDGLTGSKTLLTDQEAQAAIQSVQKDVQAKQQEKMKVEAGTNKKEGDDFLAANKSKEGVVTLPSGLQYKILTAGTGAKPTATDSVVCNYRGTLINGTEFDSSYKRGQPATFGVSGVIKGWTEALQLMPVGSKWQLFIPSDLAYGERGNQGIGPNSTLIFEVELMSIEAPDKDQKK